MPSSLEDDHQRYNNYWTSLAAGHAYHIIYALILCVVCRTIAEGLFLLLALNGFVGVMTFLVGTSSEPRVNAVMRVLWYGVLGWLHCYQFAAEQVQRGGKDDEQEATLA